MPKRKRSAAERRQKQLYLIFDDWSLGYTIREVSLPSGPSNHPAAISGEVVEQRLPPPLLRMAAHPEDRLSVGTPETLLPILDVRKRSLMFGPSLGFPLSPIFVPVGGSRLFALHSDCLQLLRRAPRQPPPDNHIPVEWEWSVLPDPPFLTIEVTSHAVHPDGPSIVISTKRRTFTFHTKKSVWTKRGKWGLPFTGKAHFDGDLGIFVGLSKDRKTRGHLCSCDRASLVVLNTGNDSTDEELPAAPAWKLCPKKLFSDNPHERHVSATLLYLGSKSKFCLVECLFFERDPLQLVLLLLSRCYVGPSSMEPAWQ